MSENNTRESIDCTDECTIASSDSPTRSSLNPFDTSICLQVRSLLGNPAAKRLLKIKTNAQAIKSELMTLLDATQDYSTENEIPSDQELADEGTFNAGAIKDFVEAYCTDNVAKYRELLGIAKSKAENADILISYEICRLILEGKIAVDEREKRLQRAVTGIRMSKNYKELERREIDKGVAQISDTEGKIKFLEQYSASLHAIQLSDKIKQQAKIAEIDNILDTTVDPLEQMKLLSRTGHYHAEKKKEAIRVRLLADALTSEETPGYLTILNRAEIDFGNGEERIIGTTIIGEAENNDTVAIVDLHASREIGTIEIDDIAMEISLDPQFLRDVLATKQHSYEIPGKILAQIVELIKNSIQNLGFPLNSYMHIGCYLNPDCSFPDANLHNGSENCFRLHFEHADGSKRQLTASARLLTDTQDRIEKSTLRGEKLAIILELPDNVTNPDALICSYKQMLALWADSKENAV